MVIIKAKAILYIVLDLQEIIEKKENGILNL
jgi:hypothetical protein